MVDEAKDVAPRTRRPRKTSPRVHLVDRLTSLGIRAGGLGVVVCVLGIFVFLVAVVKPLFDGAQVGPALTYPLLSAAEAKDLRLARLDEYRMLGLYALASGEVGWFSAQDGRTLGRKRLVGGDGDGGAEGAGHGDSAPGLTAFRILPSGALALAFADGTVRTGRLGFTTRFVSEAEASPEDRALAPGNRRALPDGMVERTERGELRQVSAELALDDPIPVGTPGVAVVRLDYRAADEATVFVALKANHELLLEEVTRRENMLTGDSSREVSSTRIPLPPEVVSLGDPTFLLVTSKGDQLYLGWTDGTVVRYDLRDREAPVLAERVDLVAEPEGVLTVFRFTQGEQSLLAGDSLGRTRAWFRVEASAVADSQAGDDPAVPTARLPASADGYLLVKAHELGAASSPVRVIATSERDKTLAIADASGTVTLRHLTSERELAHVRTRETPVVAAQITPKGDGLFAVWADGTASVFAVANPHPETTLGSLFGKVWYEGAPAPAFTWQSSSGNDDFEPKLSLVPLIFGTLKATTYSMAFAVPIALLAAIYTSEFLDRRYRPKLKTAIEVMASLPSVVLGFLAALVLAPVVERLVIAVWLAFALAPLTALGFGYLWQALPRRFALTLGSRLQFVLLLGLLVLALGAARVLSGPVEAALFAGDFKGWLDARHGTGTPGSAALAWPLVALGFFLLDQRVLVPLLSRRLRGASRSQMAWVELAKFAGLVLASLAGAWLLGAVATVLGVDPRGGVLGTYVQRNALVVGFVMGFAVIPIIYTIAEDALASVPQSLRSASLGCGATRWQTAIRVVLPVAASGIFSALMVGLGRAVGETMIVLMAAGNTPTLDFNIFSGLRTLSANIAVELPEAVKDGTLYRVLFLAALSLFLLTFVVNTIAEVVRQRFRRRAFQL